MAIQGVSKLYLYEQEGSLLDPSDLGIFFSFESQQQMDKAKKVFAEKAPYLRETAQQIKEHPSYFCGYFVKKEERGEVNSMQTLREKIDELFNQPITASALQISCLDFAFEEPPMIQEEKSKIPLMPQPQQRLSRGSFGSFQKKTSQPLIKAAEEPTEKKSGENKKTKKPYHSKSYLVQMVTRR